MREVVRGNKHNLRKSGNCKAQISAMCEVNDTDLCIAICRFSQVMFVTSNNFTHNLLFYFQKLWHYLCVCGSLGNQILKSSAFILISSILDPLLSVGSLSLMCALGLRSIVACQRLNLSSRSGSAPATDQSDAVSCARHKYSFDDCLLRMRALKRQCHDNR